ncbi:hypothetical protein M0R88_00010 [Halorussus gelatinilyticus]|uniref:Twin-arginine translocation signal domain-containing protein n=1 Tax=Halorussus gelatinilyticus TaxID=2937524 RepID=A0A8U0IJT2_9EURY|nr:hypothetical protein [Halorussus gelatinilyticus]UPW00504.1 hypothetical protein M0R88_00010 [Halorussus gelatinilyticus]
MTDDSPGRRSSDGTRRRFLKGIGAASAGAFGLPLLSDEGRAASESRAPEKFRVTGREIVQTKIRPEEVTVRTRKISPDLKKRYGLTPPVLTKTETFRRPKPEADDLPERDTRTDKREWDTYYAKPDEWKDYHQRSGGVGIQSKDPDEENHPYGVWEYEAVDGGYETAAPMNVISERSTGDVAGVLTSNGWTDNVVQYNRHAYNSATNQFEQQDKSVATGTFGFLGRKHLKMWEFEGYVSGSAHVDNSVPHEATSFEDAEQAIEGVFDDASGWYGSKDYYDMNNGYQLDHDNYATKLVEY